MRSLLLPILVLPILLAPPAFAEDDEAPRPETIVVGTKEAPPFSMKNESGEWEGLSIELWRRIGAANGFETRFEERSLDALFEGVEGGELAAAVAALTMTAEREERLDFSHPYFTSGLGIAVRPEKESGWTAVISRVFSLSFLKTIGVLAAILAAAGLALWLFERRRNREQFGGSPAKGFGNAFWWSAVTLTTVGYGDKAPVTFGGRLIAMIWMFAGILIIASITASMASALTVERLAGSVHGPEDLPGLRVATVPASTSDRYLAAREIRRVNYPDVDAALRGLADGRVDAVVYDHPLLIHSTQQDAALAERILVLPRIFERQDYAIALKQGSPYRERLNRAILAVIVDPSWNEVLERYVGN